MDIRYIFFGSDEYWKKKMKQDKGIEDSEGRAMVDRMVQPLSR